MKRQSFYLISLTISFLTLCCKSSLTEVPIEIESALSLDTLRIKFDENYSESHLGKWQYQSIEESDILIKSDFREDHLYLFLFNLSEKKYEYTLKIPSYGPNGFKSPSVSFYVHNLDSIFIFPTSQNSIYLYDQQINLITKFDFNSDHFLSFSSNEQQQGTVLVDGKLYLNSIPFVDPNSKTFFEQTYATYSLDLESSVLTPIRKYPKEIFGKILPTSFLGSQHVKAFDSLLITNFYFTEDLLLYSFKGEAFSESIASVPWLQHLKGLDQPINNQSLESLALQIEYPLYYNLLFDRHQRQLYRIAKHINPKYRSLSQRGMIEEFQNEDSDILNNTLIVLDGNLETKKRLNIPFSNFYIPTKSGLVIESYNEGNGLEKEFVVLKLD